MHCYNSRQTLGLSVVFCYWEFEMHVFGYMCLLSLSCWSVRWLPMVKLAKVMLREKSLTPYPKNHKWSFNHTLFFSRLYTIYWIGYLCWWIDRENHGGICLLFSLDSSPLLSTYKCDIAVDVECCLQTQVIIMLNGTLITNGNNFISASGLLHCHVNNGGCWKDTRGGRTYSACVVSSSDLLHE